MSLPTDLKNDILDAEMSGRRRYNMINNPDGTVSFVDVTTYTQIGSAYGAEIVNEQNATINELNNSLTDIHTIIDKVKKGVYSMPLLDTKNPLFTFTNTDLSYTATQDCYLYGTLYPNTTQGRVYVNGCAIAFSDTATNSNRITCAHIENFKLQKGDEVTVSSISTNSNMHTLHILKAIEI